MRDLSKRVPGATAATRVIVLVNPAAGKGRGETAGRAAVARLRELGAEVHVHSGSSAKETLAHAAAAVLDRPDVLVVVGGDGTLASILEAVAHSNLPIALVPAGTGNDFARALGLHQSGPQAAAQAAEIALRGEVRQCDVARATCPEQSVMFLTIAALGFDARVSERTNMLRWPRGAARYYLALFIELVRLRALDFSLKIDGEEAEVRPGIVVAVGNTRTYGGGMPICPAADPSDGSLDLTHVAPLGRFELLRLFPLLLKAKHTARAEVLTRRCASVEISAPGLIAYADGERVGTESVSISILSGALRIYVPKETG